MGLDEARQAVRGVSPFPLVLEEIEPPDTQPEGRYRTRLPPDFPDEHSAYMDSGDWAVEVLVRGVVLCSSVPPRDNDDPERRPE